MRGCGARGPGKGCVRPPSLSSGPGPCRGSVQQALGPGRLVLHQAQHETLLLLGGPRESEAAGGACPEGRALGSWLLVPGTRTYRRGAWEIRTLSGDLRDGGGVGVAARLVRERAGMGWRAASGHRPSREPSGGHFVLPRTLVPLRTVILRGVLPPALVFGARRGDSGVTAPRDPARPFPFCWRVQGRLGMACGRGGIALDL